MKAIHNRIAEHLRVAKAVINEDKEQFESNSQQHLNLCAELRAVINEDKEQFESNSQQYRTFHTGLTAVINEDKEQFESNSQQVEFSYFQGERCDQRR